jgi:PucR C-terminal helix-turn-helix domain/Major Facilitator Superfamily
MNGESMTSPEGTEPGEHDAACSAVESDVDRQGGAFSWRLVTSLLVTSTLNPINSSLIATALVPIAHALSVSVGRTAILVSALYLASSIAQPTAGKLAEEFGPRRVSIVGILFVLLGGIIGGVAQDIPTLTVARVLIGIGTSAGYPAAMVIIRRRTIWAGRIGNVLDGFRDLGDEEREILFDTFQAWQDNDSSVRVTAQQLTVHPNTVRHRLRRIEKHTGRSLSRPRDLAELCLAFEVHRRLM